MHSGTRWAPTSYKWGYGAPINGRKKMGNWGKQTTLPYRSYGPPFIQGSLNYPCWGNQTIQMCGNIEGFSVNNNALFGLVSYNDPVISLVFVPTWQRNLEDHPRTGKWLGSPPFISHGVRPFGRGPTTPGIGDLRPPCLLTAAYPLRPGMILQAVPVV